MNIRTRPTLGPIGRFVRNALVKLGLKEPRTRIPGTRLRISY